MSNSREAKVSNSGINTIDGKKEKAIEDCLEIIEAPMYLQ